MSLDGKTVFVTGGAGFIGSALVRHLITHSSANVVVVDCLTYAANTDNLAMHLSEPRLKVEAVDIRNYKALKGLFEKYAPNFVIHLAAESHVDRSIDSPLEFVTTNVNGTCNLLEIARHYYHALSGSQKDRFRFLHVSTDEVYGSLGPAGLFTETSPYQPNSPYSASKAASDHFVRAWHETYGFPTLITNCTNNYGPYQFPEKLIPLMVLKALAGEELPVYGAGENVRDWVFVEDHVEALCCVLENGVPGQQYNIGGNCEMQNLQVVQMICDLVDELRPQKQAQKCRDLVTFVTDRPGHDQRYAMDISYIERELGWRPRLSFEAGLRQTVAWYINNEKWWRHVQSGAYLGRRLGLGTAS